MEQSINLVFYIASYEVIKAKIQEQELNKIRNKYK